MGKRQESAKLTRENIVQAAKMLHEERGLSNVSVDEIVAKANVSKGSFYVYFRRKEDVASEIAFRQFDALKESLEQLPGTAAVKLGRFLTESVRYIEEQGLSICKEWMKSAVSPNGEDNSGVAKFSFDRDFILKTIFSAKENGEISGDAPVESLTDMIMAEYYGCVTMWSMTDGNFPMLKCIEQFADTLSGMLKQYQ